MNYTDLNWHALTTHLYEDRAFQQPYSEEHELHTARLWTEAARRVKLIARKGFRRQIPACDLEDIEQRVLLKLLAPEHLQAAAGARAPGIYIAQMIRNEAFDFLRRDLREKLAARIAPPAAVVSPDEYESAALLDRLDVELDMLSADDRALLAKRFWDGSGITAIAGELDLPYSTIAKRLVRAIARLRARLAEPDA